MNLLEFLVESILHWAEVWVGGRQMGVVEQVQMKNATAIWNEDDAIEMVGQEEVCWY